MCPRRCNLRWCAAALAALLTLGMAAACRAGAPPAQIAAEWRRAQAQWRPGDLYALSAGYAAWRALADSPETADSPEGRAARERLAAADARYRRALKLITDEQPGAQEELRAGKALAPMDPALYLPLARACRAQSEDFPAIQYYRSFLSLLPTAAEAETARTELRQLETEHPEVLDTAPPRFREGGLSAAAQILGQSARRADAVLVGVGVALGLFLALAVAAVTRAVLRGLARRGRSLAALASRHPELHPALSYLIGRLRHELLKHRVGSAQDLVAATVLPTSAGAPLSAGQQQFLRARLGSGGGSSLLADWQGHLAAFRRALGPEFDLGETDPGFRAAGRALAVLAEPRFLDERRVGPWPARQSARLRRAVETLRRFDRDLATLAARLSRTIVDRALLEEAVRAVRDEAAAGQGALDELSLLLPRETEPIVVEVYRADLLLMLKNVLRNALLAVARSAPPRRVRLDVTLDLLPTGEEVVRLRVHDTSPEPLTTEQVYALGQRPEARGRGLGLVIAALSLYSGAISVEPSDAGYEKCVTVQLFRALEVYCNSDIEKSENQTIDKNG